jgi:hypothetical protein
MPKIDLKKENKELYDPSAKEVSIVDVPKMNFLMIDGEGDPNTSHSNSRFEQKHMQSTVKNFNSS